MKNAKENVLGMDLGDRKHAIHVLDTCGELLEASSIDNNIASIKALSAKYPGIVFIMEAGTHSPWISRFLISLGHKVLVANPRKLKSIYGSDNKTDKRDAEMLARMYRFEPKLLYPIKHNSEKCQRDLAVLKSRNTLVNERTALMNTSRTTLKSLGVALPESITPENITKKLKNELQRKDYKLAKPFMMVLATLNKQIKLLDKQLSALAAKDYPITQKLQEIAGVGPITALCYVLVIEDNQRFRSNRDVGPFLGLVPKRDQSGDSDKQLGITKAGNNMLRRLLVNCSQYILGNYGPPCQLRDSGLKIAGQGSKIAKKKAVIATSRKLAVLMLALWKNEDSHYVPYHA